MDLDDNSTSEASIQKTPSKKHQQGLFVIGTDIGVGKTIAVCALGTFVKGKRR